jgi:hypothetical protein
LVFRGGADSNSLPTGVSVPLTFIWQDSTIAKNTLPHHEKFWLHVWLIILLQIQTILNVQDELSLKIQVYMYQQTKYFLHDNKVSNSCSTL